MRGLEYCHKIHIYITSLLISTCSDKVLFWFGCGACTSSAVWHEREWQNSGKNHAVQMSSVKMAYKFAKVGSGRNALFYWLFSEQEDVMTSP